MKSRKMQREVKLNGSLQRRKEERKEKRREEKGRRRDNDLPNDQVCFRLEAFQKGGLPTCRTQDPIVRRCLY